MTSIIGFFIMLGLVGLGIVTFITLLQFGLAIIGILITAGAAFVRWFDDWRKKDWRDDPRLK